MVQHKSVRHKVGKTNNLSESSVLASKSHDQPTPSDAYGISHMASDRAVKKA
jgi:hypothetical protein